MRIEWLDRLAWKLNDRSFASLPRPCVIPLGLPRRRRIGNGVEQLEQKLCLSASFGDTASLASPQWFESLDTSTEQLGDRWIVQLSAANTARTASVTAAQELLLANHLPVTVLRGLGRPGLLLVTSSQGQEETQQLVEASEIFSEVALDQSLEAQVNIPPQDSEFLPSQYSFQNSGQFFGTIGADIKAVEAWRKFTDNDDRPGMHEVVVSVIDSGVDYTHPDLARNIWLNQGEIPPGLRSQLTDTDGDGLITFVDLGQPANGTFVTDSNGNGFIDGADLLSDPAWENNVDDDGNGLTDDLIGWDFLNNDNDPIDDHRHGTHVAGTIGAVGDNGFGVAGVNWDVSVMPLKFLNTRLEGAASDAILAINYSAMMRTQFETDVRVINASWGTLGDFNPKLQEAITVAQSADIVVVAAAGNGDVTGRGINLDGESIGFFPASFDLDNIISVAATDNTDSLARFSNFGSTSVDISAPGVGIIGLNPGGDYVLRTGTSMAAPHVSGTVALLASLRPFATASELRDAILTSTTSLGSLNGKVSTGGRLNAETALTVDTFAPRASLAQANDITEDTTNDQLIVMQVNDDTSVDRTTFDSSDLLVRRKGDGAEFDVPLSTAPTSNAAEVFAFYQMPAPGGRWLIEDNGVYEIIVQSGEIADTTGRFNRETVIGSFEVAIQFIGQEPLTTTTDGLIAGALRSAVQATNAEAGLNTIVLQPGETYTLDVSGADEDAAATGDLDITDELVIRGNGATIQIAGGIDRAFDVLPSGTLTLLDVTITGGSAARGGAVRNAGTLTVERSLLTGNSATDGGAVSSTGTTTLINTTISGNSASTGGGVYHSSGSLLLSSVTVSENSATSSGGGIASTANAQLQNTIVGGNTTTGSNPDTSGTFTSNGHNLISILGMATGFIADNNGDLVGTSANPMNALLGELKNNGGLTSTHRLLPNSPAIDAGDNALAPTIDQRNIQRPIDANRTRTPIVDIGAHERNLVDILGIKFRDDNSNGVQDEGEPGLAGWTIYLDLNNNAVLDAGEPSIVSVEDDPGTTGVDETGTYVFSEVEPNEYIVREQLQPGWELTTPVGNNISSIDLSTLDGTTGFRLDGINAGDHSGDSVSSAGDVNGDGFDDLIIGAYGGDPGGHRGAGESYVVFGKSDGFGSAVDLSTLDGITGFRLDGVDADDLSGSSVSNAGDVNGDGFDDLIVGASLAAPDGDSSAGESYVVFGKSGGFGSALDLSTLDGTTGFRVDGIDAGDQSGRSVSSVGDVNGDGFDDLIIGAPYGDPGGDYAAGESYVVFGRATPIAVPGTGFWNVRASAGNFATQVDFGNAALPGTITGQVFRDLNNNSIRDAGEAGIENWQVFLDEDGDNALDAGETVVTTDPEGRYSFPDITPLQTYRVVQVVQTSFEQTRPDPSGGPVIEVSLGAGEDRSDVDFGNLDTVGGVGLGLGTLEGTYFVDSNENGDPDLGEGVGGVSLFLDINNSGTRDEVGGTLEPVTVTENDGRYLFEELAEGTYTVRALNQQNLQQQFPRSNSLSVNDVSVGDFPQSIATGFFNDDNLPDLVVANVFTNDLTILLNNGTSFDESRSVFAGGLQPQSVAVADFDQNGMDDLIVGYAAGGKISVLFGLGSGQFSTPTTIDTGGGGEVNVSTGLFTNDQFPDIAAVSGISDQAYVIANTTGSNFNVLHTLVTGEGPTRAVFANLQQNLAFGPDDNPDLLVSSFIDNRVDTFFNNGSGSLSSTSPLSVGIKPTDVAVADFDGDGHLDAAVTNQGSDTVTVLFNKGQNGELNSSRKRSYPAGSGPSSVEAVDIDSDGFVDLIVTNGSDSNLAVLRNLGDGVFQSPESFGVALFPLPLAWSVTTADFDLDGDLDLAVAKGKDNQAAVLTNTLIEGAYRVILSDGENVTDLNFLATIPPVPVISSLESSPTNAATIPMTVSFGVEVSNFVSSDLNVNGGSVSDFMTSDNQTWTFNVTPTGGGPITIDIAAGVAQASGGIDTAAASQFSITSDRTLPTAGLSDVSPSVRTTPVMNIAVTFNEDVTGVDIADLRLTRNGRDVDLGALTVSELDAAQYSLDLASVSDIPGNYELTLKAADSGIADTAGNLFAADVIESWSFEGVGIELDGSFNLLITETSLTGFMNNLTLTTVGDDLVITDSNVDLISAVGTAASSREVRIPLTEISGGQIIANPGGNADRLDASGLTTFRLTIDGGSGDDTLIGGQQDDTLRGGPGNDTLIVSGNRHLKLLADRSTGSGFDIFTEFELAQLVGGDGNNRLDATAATLPVSLFGGAGNDTLLGSSRTDDLLDGGAGIDRAELTGLSITLTDSNAPGMSTDQAESIEGIQLLGVSPGSLIDASGYSQGSVTIVGSSGADTLIGSPGDDLMIAAGGNDSVTGNGGNDLIFGRRGKDTLNGNSGDDTIFGGAGSDTIDGGVGDDLILGGANSDVLHGGSGQDTLRSNSGHDTVFGNSGNDVLVGGGGHDGLNGGEGNDLLLGQSGSDTLLGFAGNDTLNGGTRSDTLHGGSDDDSLDGAAGKHALNGGAGDNQINEFDEIDENFSETDFPALLEMP